MYLSFFESIWCDFFFLFLFSRFLYICFSLFESEANNNFDNIAYENLNNRYVCGFSGNVKITNIYEANYEKTSILFKNLSEAINLPNIVQNIYVYKDNNKDKEPFITIKINNKGE